MALEQHWAIGSGMGEESQGPHRLSIPSSDGMTYVDVDRIVRLEAEGSYTHVILGPGTKYIVSRNLSALEARLPTMNFFRCHHSHVINLLKVVKLVRNDGYHVLLSTGMKICVSRRKWAALVAAMDRF